MMGNYHVRFGGGRLKKELSSHLVSRLPNCFAGCGGGSIIDFWAKWREVHGQDNSFIATITDLAETLLQRERPLI